MPRDRRPVSGLKSGRDRRIDPVQRGARPLPARRRRRRPADQRSAGNPGRQENLHRPMVRLPPARQAAEADAETPEPVAFIGYGDALGPASGRRWIEANVDPGRIAAKANSAHCMLELALQGVGAALLPCYPWRSKPGPGPGRLSAAGTRRRTLDADPRRSSPGGAGAGVHGFRRGRTDRSIAGPSRARNRLGRSEPAAPSPLTRSRTSPRPS